MNISIFGLGYVGLTSGVCLADLRHKIIGVDIKGWKVKSINSGISPVNESYLEEKLNKAIRNLSIHCTENPMEAVEDSEVSLICVGTPAKKNGDIDLTYIKRVVNQIGKALRKKEGYHVVVIRSTVLPGTTEGVVIPIIEQLSDKKSGKDFGICMNPEFLREGTMIEDFLNPELIVIGEIDKRAGDYIVEMYKKIRANVIRVDLKTAEMIKYANNAFHAVKISFANEIGNICKQYGLDARKVMQVLCLDLKLNISPYYLKPGFAFGGSCLPKDVRTLVYKSTKDGYTPCLLKSALQVNENQIERAYLLMRKMVKDEFIGKRISVLGVAFKENTDDIRESPVVKLLDKLLTQGAVITIYDPIALDASKKYFKGKVEYANRIKSCLKNTDFCIVSSNTTPIDELSANLKLMKTKKILDLSTAASYFELRNSNGVEYEAISQ